MQKSSRLFWKCGGSGRIGTPVARREAHSTEPTRTFVPGRLTVYTRFNYVVQPRNRHYSDLGRLFGV